VIGRAIARGWFLDALDAEIERRRQAAIVAAGGDPREALIRMLDAMGERLRAAPDYVKLTAAQQRKTVAQFESWLRRQGYS
jgi:hypothetical protein